jgi:hypothetical protein
MLHDVGNGSPLAMSHDFKASEHAQDMGELQAYLGQMEDIARHASTIDHFRLKYTIQRIRVAIQAVDSARQATRHAVQQQLIAETMLAEMLVRCQEDG